ncbi:uncharacterized protein LOC135707314 [Ochlerotatus camptorhynchus]|uniref:uncharacterized protein LOC135707314 n=1 Tax=Ochlerotatus camptorhynchus TaxID=644619 RepID=UPI0031D93E40
MGRKRLNVAKKRVLKQAANKNLSFVVQSLPELKQELLENPAQRKGKNAKSEKPIDLQWEPSSSEMIMVPEYNFESNVGAEEIDMVEPTSSAPPPQATRTYSRKKSIEQLLQEWETVPCASNNGIPENSIQIVHVEQLYDKGNGACGSSPEVVIVNTQSECSCGKLDEVENYKKLSESLQKEKDALLLRNAQLEAQNAKLLDSLTSKLLPTPEKPFKEEEGFLDCETLQRLSHEAGDKDYLFVKFLMMQLFPDGFVGRSVTGRRSNNPSGRPKKKDAVCPVENTHDTGDGEATGDETEGETAKVPLDPVKVRWIKSMNT